MSDNIDIRWSEVDQALVATDKSRPGCMAHGSSPQEARRQINSAIELWREVEEDGSGDRQTTS